VLKKDSAHTSSESPYGLGIRHSGGDHEDPPLKASLPGGGKELEAVFLAQVKVEQNEVDRHLAEDIDGFTDRSATSRHLEVRLALDKPA